MIFMVDLLPKSIREDNLFTLVCFIVGIHNVSRSLIHQDVVYVDYLCTPLKYIVEFITVEVSTVSDYLHFWYVITYLGKLWIDYIHSNKDE